MALYARLFNGQVLEFPDDTPDEVIHRVAQEEVSRLRAAQQPVVAEPAPQPVARSTERTFGESIKDIGAGLLSGTGSALAFPGQVVSLVPGLREAGQALASPGEALSQYAQDLKSEGLKAREAIRSQALSEAEKEGVLSSFATAITSTLKDPALISTFLAEQLPLLLPPLAAARVTQMAGRGAVSAAGQGLSGDAARLAAEEAAKQVNRRAYAAAVGTGATMQGADISSGAYQRAYDAAIQQGMSPEEAADAATGSARIAGAGAFGTSLLTQRLPGARAIEERMARLPGTGGRVRAGVGEATSEGLEEAGGALFQNIGVRQVDPTVTLTEGVGAAAGLGTLGGGFFGTLLGKKGKEDLAPGQREGESLQQTINRLSAERQQLAGQLAAPEQEFPNAIQLMETINQNPEQGYGTIVNYISSLQALPDSPAKTQALNTAEELRERLNVEQIQRQVPSQQNIVTAQDLRNLGFAQNDWLARELVGKDLAKPDDAIAVLEVLRSEAKREDLPEQRRARVSEMLATVDEYISTLPGSAFYAGEIDTTGSGAGSGVVQQPDRQPAPAVGATERGGVGAAGPLDTETLARTTQQQPALTGPEFVQFENLGKLANGQPITVSQPFVASDRVMIQVDIGGMKVPFYISTGRGGKTTVPAGKWYPFFGFGPNDGWLNKGTEEDINNFYGSPILRSVANQLNKKYGDLRSQQRTFRMAWDGVSPRSPEFQNRSIVVGNLSEGFAPSDWNQSREKGYQNIHAAIKRLSDIATAKAIKPKKGEIQNPVTAETLEQLGIKPNSALAKRILGKSQNDPAVQEEISKLRKRKAEQAGGAPEEGTSEEGTTDVAEEAKKILGSHAVEGIPIQYVATASLKISKDVPQFKSGANEQGIVEKLTGKFDGRDMGPLQVWRRINGDLEVISGRHRLDLAQANNIPFLPVQIYDESQGFDVIQAKTLDAELNIRDGYGKVKDYVVYFQGTQISREEAKSRNLLEREAGRRGFDIANNGSPEIIAAHRADRISDQDAALVANAAPQDGRLQAVGLKVLEIDKKNGQSAVNTIKGVKAVLKDQGEQAGSVDMFGFDSSLMQEAEELASIATRKQDEISRRIAVLSGVTKNPKIAAQEGIDVKDPDAVKKRIAELRKQRSEWDRWETNPDLIAQMRQERGGAETRTPASFAQEIAEGKQLTSPADVQYYQNNADAIEAELKKLQDAAAEEAQADAQTPMFSLRPEEMEAKFRELEARAAKATTTQKPTVTEPPDQAKEAIKARILEIDKTLTALLTRVMRKYGLNDVGLELVNDMKANGEYSNRLIRLASDHPNPVLHLRHESIHALKELGFFTPRQWDVLTEKARTEWLDTYLKNVPHTDTQSRYDAYLEMFKADGMTNEQAQEALIEEAIADAFSYFQKAKPPAGLIAAILNRINSFFKAIKEFLDVGNLTPDEIFGKIEAGELKPSVVPVKPNSWKANTAEKEKAESYEEQNGIKPYVSEGQITIPIEGENKKLSIKSPYRGRALTGYVKKRRDGTTEVVPPKFNDPLTGLPLNKDGTVTVYLPTTNETAREIIRTKRIKAASPTANRIYLTNESSGKAILGNLGNIDSPVDGANMMLKLDPQLLHIDQEFPNGRKDFFLPIAEGEAFAQKAAMTKLFTMNLPRDKALSKDTKLTDLERRIQQSVQEYLTLSAPQQKARLEEAQEILKTAHNIGSLLTVNGKLEKTNTGGYGLNNYNGKDVMSMGLGMASAQRINEQKLSTCPNSAMCEGLCLGETSGQNELYGGEGQFRSGPRLAQYLKTEALVQHPEEFSVLLYDEIRRFQKAAVDEDYQPSVRLNVTSDFRPQVFKAIIDAFPGVEFYDYTKLPSNTIAPNHHLTYSSTGASQVVNGEVIVNPGSNWKKMVERMLQGQNVAMAFTSKTTMPDFVVDEATGERFQVWDGDNYDARFLDPKPGQPENLLNRGMIVGLTNKDRTTPPNQAAKKYKGFFMHYERSRDGDTLVIPDQDALKKSKTIEIVPKLSLRAQTQTPAFKRWFGDSKVVDENNEPLVVYHGTTGNIVEFKKTALGVNTKAKSAYEGFFFTNSPENAAEYAGGEATRRGPVSVKEILAAWPDNDVKAFKDAQAYRDSLKPKGARTDSWMMTDEWRARNRAANDLFERLLDKNAAGSNVMPVFLSLQNPLVHDMKREQFRDISYAELVKKAKSQKRDGVIIKNTFDPKFGDVFVVFEPTQIKSAIGNVGTFSPTEPDIRKSIRSNIRSQLTPQIWQRVDDTIGVRDERTWPQRIMDAISPTNWSTFRENALNRYNQLAVNDREYIRQNGGARLMADESAEAAALMSDLGGGLTAAAFGVNDRIGGIPVYKNGLVRIDNLNGTVKGPLPIFAPLAAYNNPEIYRLYQFWVTAQRGERYNALGKKTPFTQADMQAVQDIEKQYPEFRSIHNEWIKYNNGLVDFAVQAGVLTPGMAAEFKKHGDYFPMYKYMEDDVVTGPKTFVSIANVPIPKKFKGDEVNPMGDFFENVIRNSQSLIQAGIKNIAAQKATKIAEAIGQVRPLGYNQTGPGGATIFVPAKPATMLANYYRVLVNGEERYYAAADMKFINAIKALNIPDLPFIGLLSGPANVLRNLVTKTPDFMMANMLRDSLSAWATSGTNILPIVSTIRNFGKAIANKSPELNMLVNTGVIGGYDYSQGVEMSAKIFAQDLRKIAGARTTMEKLTSPATSVWDALEKGSSASDAATRMEVFKKTLEETGNEAEAVFRALEVLNFNRRGRSAIVRILTAAVPFLNARIQGLDVLYRAGIRPIFANDATPYEQQVAKTFWVRGMTIMALSAMYWAMTHDDDDYKKQEQETRDNYWLIPSMGIKIPIPFEVGVMFKVIPERVLELSFGSDTGKDFVNSMARQLLSTFAFNPIPQTFLPVVEAATNFSFFTQRPIIGQGMENISAPYQAAPTTSRTATGLADAYNAIIDGLPANVKSKIAASPMIIDQLIQGYTGSMGMYAVMAIDGIISANSDIPSASKRFEQMPVIRRFAIDPLARGTVTSFYDLKNSVDQVVRTANLLERTGQYSEYVAYVRENMKVLASKEYVSDLEKNMKELREMKIRARIAPTDADTKRDQLAAIQEMENNLTMNIQTIKKLL